jgi:nitroreductase
MFIDLERKRRSIRKYADKAIEPEKIDMLVEAALRAPSSRGNNPWEFVVVRDRALIQKLAKAKPAGAGFVAGAPLVIVVCADTEKSDVWVEDASIASSMILFAAQAAGLGACWVQIRNRPHDDDATAGEYIRALLKLPDRVAVLSIMSLGYPDESHPPHSKDELLYDQVHDTQYGSSWPKPADTQ